MECELILVPPVLFDHWLTLLRFLLAKVHLSSLKGKSSPKAIRTALRTLHTGSDAYDHAYKDAMERIEQQGMEKRDLARNILSWITCAKRQLKINELLHAVAVEVGLPYLDEDNLSDMQYMISVCAGLVAVDEESCIIRLVHYTTQEFFERTWRTWFPEAHRNIAMISITYLSFEQFTNGPCANWEEYRDRLQGNPVYEYAARYWGYHAKEAYSEMKDLVDRFLERNSTLASTAQVLSLERVVRSSIPTAHKGVSGLHIVAWFGLDDKVKELLQDPRYHTSVDNKGQTALHWATRNAQALTVELLIREGVDVNIADKQGKTALHYAALQGDNHLIQLLVRNDAHLEAVDNDGQTPFLTAADNVKVASVRELLTYDPAISAVDYKNRNALHLAIIAAKDESAHLTGILLSQGVCPTLCDAENMTPLHYAVAIANTKIVQLFLEAGVDINHGIKRKCWRRSPKVTTKARRFLYVLDQPLDKTEVNIQDAVGLTPLHFAVCAGDWSMTEFLLSKGANPNVRCSEGDTPLHIALRRDLVNDKYKDAWTDIEWKVERLESTISDYEEDYADEVYRSIDEARLGVINMLLACTDIDVNIQNAQLDSPLHTMTTRTHSYIVVAELLRKGADPHKRNKKGQTALHLACEADDLNAIDRFLNAGCSITTEDAEGLTALHYAARANRYESVKLILDRHKDIAPSLCLSADKQGRTLLHHCLQSQSDPQVHMITLLLDHGANVDHIGLDENSPLSTYLRPRRIEDRTEICRFLLKRGADPLWTGSNGRNLAHVAMYNWKPEVEVLKLLKAHGVDLSLKDKDARSILHHGAIHGSISEEMICFLQRDNIDGICERDLKDKSPLMYATEAAKIKRRRLEETCPERWQKSYEAFKQMENHKMGNATVEINLYS
jgi:ankyrin repeat protein